MPRMGYSESGSVPDAREETPVDRFTVTQDVDRFAVTQNDDFGDEMPAIWERARRVLLLN